MEPRDRIGKVLVVDDTPTNRGEAARGPAGEHVRRPSPKWATDTPDLALSNCL